MKRIIKFILFRIIRRPVYDLVKFIVKPSEKFRSKLRFIGKFQVKTNDGKKFYLYNNAYRLETNIYWAGLDGFSWENATRTIWIYLSQSSNTIFDIGSNSGVFAILAKAYNPDSLVVAFEPQPNVYKVLVKNNLINNYNILCENIALSDKEGQLPFYNYGPDAFSYENTTAGSLNKNWRPDQQSSILVTVKELNNYVEEKKINKIDLIKIDVETLEFKVLSGYDKYISIHQPIIILEIQDCTVGANIESLFNLENYVYFNIDETTGLKRVTELGKSEENKNYLLCPKLKLDRIGIFL